MRDKVTMAGCDTSRAGVNSRRQPQSAGIGRATTARSVGLTLPAAIVRGIVVIAALVTGLAAPDSLCAAARSSPSKWNTDGKFEAALDRPISAIWSGVSLRRIVQRIITDRNIAILIDRRVDPDQFLKVDSDNIPLVELLRRLAEQTRSGFRITGNVAYIGPEHAAAKLRTLIHLRRTETRRQTVDRSRRRGLLQRRTINWNSILSSRAANAFRMICGEVQRCHPWMPSRLCHYCWCSLISRLNGHRLLVAFVLFRFRIVSSLNGGIDRLAERLPTWPVKSAIARMPGSLWTAVS